jgi:hypothetical protein
MRSFLTLLSLVLLAGCDSASSLEEGSFSLSDLAGEYTTPWIEVTFPDFTQYHRYGLSVDVVGNEVMATRIIEFNPPAREEYQGIDPRHFEGGYDENVARISLRELVNGERAATSCEIPIFVWEDSEVLLWDCSPGELNIHFKKSQIDG